MSSLRSIIPPYGNPVRPIFLLLAGFFGLMLVGFPILTYSVGLGARSIIGVEIIIVLAGLVGLGFTLWLASKMEESRADLLTTAPWATWQLSREEYRTFARSERRRSVGWALAYAIGGLAMGVYFLTKVEDRITGVIMIVVFLLAAAVIATLGSPLWRASENAREVRIGERGVQVLGLYFAFEAPFTELRFVELKPDDRAVLEFYVRSGNRTQEIRVPVAQGHWDDAVALVERFRIMLAGSGRAEVPMTDSRFSSLT